MNKNLSEEHYSVNIADKIQVKITVTTYTENTPPKTSVMKMTAADKDTIAEIEMPPDAYYHPEPKIKKDIKLTFINLKYLNEVTFEHLDDEQFGRLLSSLGLFTQFSFIRG